MNHINTDEVFGSMGAEGRFSKTTSDDSRSPYSAGKAVSDFLVQVRNHTLEVPMVRTNFLNNYGLWQFPEKLNPMFT